jgi:hypothetical protein
MLDKNNKDMDNTFKHSIKLKIDKPSGLAHLSVRSSEYKVEVFKLSISDIADMFAQFKTQMRDAGEDVIKIVPTFIEENNDEVEE